MDEALEERGAENGRHRYWLLAGPVLAMFIAGWNLSRAGLGRLYFTAASVSMTKSWHNFWFASFDQGGYMTTEKPPLPVWLGAAMIKVFGLNSWSVLVPSILAAGLGVYALSRCVLLVSDLRTAVLAGLSMAVVPGVIAVARSNYGDVFVLAASCCAAWACLAAVVRKKPSLYVVMVFCLGIGFMSKMLFAYQVVPALLLVIVLFGGGSLLKRASHVAMVAGGLFISTFWYPVLFDLSSKSARPYAANTAHNSMLELVFGWNGLHRPGEPPGTPPLFAGRPGFLRALGPAGDQATWWVAFAVVGAVLAGRAAFVRRDKVLGAGVVLSSAWLVATAATFSAATSVVHDYYIVQLVPGVVMLSVLGLRELRLGANRWWFVGAGVFSAGLASYYIHPYSPFIAVFVCVAGVIGSLAVVFKKNGGLALLVLGPLVSACSVWFISPVDWAPVARLDTSLDDTADSRGLDQSVLEQLRVLSGPRAVWILAVPSFSDAEADIIKGWAVMTIGGMQARTEHGMSEERLVQLVKDEKLRYVALGGVHGAQVLDVAGLVRSRCALRYENISQFENFPLSVFDCKALAGT